MCVKYMYMNQSWPSMYRSSPSPESSADGLWSNHIVPPLKSVGRRGATMQRFRGFWLRLQTRYFVPDAGWHRLQCGRLVNVTVDMARGWGDPRISEVFVGCLIFLHVPCWGDLKVMTLTSRPYCTCVERARELTNKNQQIKSHSDMSPA